MVVRRTSREFRNIWAARRSNVNRVDFDSVDVSRAYSEFIWCDCILASRLVIKCNTEILSSLTALVSLLFLCAPSEVLSLHSCSSKCTSKTGRMRTKGSRNFYSDRKHCSFVLGGCVFVIILMWVSSVFNQAANDINCSIHQGRCQWKHGQAPISKHFVFDLIIFNLLW